MANGGVGGSTVARAAASITTLLASLPDDSGTAFIPTVVMNWGVNDLYYDAPLVEATWKANYLTIIDACAAKWPNAQIWLMKPWTRGSTTECNTLAGWIDAIVAARSTVANAGPDERTWLEGGDDGATMTSDGIHYSTAGHRECADEWYAALTA